MIRKRIYFILLTMVMACTVMTSCSEDDGVEDEFADWQLRNDSYFNTLTDSIQKLIDGGRTDWKRIRTWSKGEGDFLSNVDYIIVHVEENAPASETASPMFTDSVAVHYQGRLIPSANNPKGLIFDTSYLDPFDKDVAVTRTFSAGGVVDGFSTALQHMRRGDHWTVYIPYQLGYGSRESSTSSIPAYSSLIFDIRLKDFWSKKAEE